MNNQPAHLQTPPIIGISGSHSSSASVIAMHSMLRAQGAQTVFLKQDVGALDASLQYVSAVVILGNDYDIDPKDYNAPSIDPHTVLPVEEEDVTRMTFEKKLVERCFEDKLPMLGVCGGMQRINVTAVEETLTGSEIVQHVSEDGATQSPHLVASDISPNYVPVQLVKIAPDSMLSKIAHNQTCLYKPLGSILPDNIYAINSLHHQAIGKVRKGFNISAISPDGVIEAIESQNPDEHFVLGVQWHPEFGSSNLGANIAGEMVQQAEEYRQKHGTQLRYSPDDALMQCLPDTFTQQLTQYQGRIEELFLGQDI